MNMSYLFTSERVVYDFYVYDWIVDGDQQGSEQTSVMRYA